MSDYHESQNLITRAQAATRVGQTVRARALFREAAEMQRRLVEAMPHEQVWTRLTFGLSAASLFYKANDIDEAERLARLFLAEAPMGQRARGGLQALLRLIENRHREA